MSDVKAICPKCGNAELVNNYAGLTYHVELNEDGTIRNQEAQGGEFDSTTCSTPRCDFITYERTFHTVEVEAS